MKTAFLINAVIEGIFGAVALAVPAVVWAGGDALALSNGRSFGVAALSVAVLSALAARRAQEPAVRGLVLPVLVLWHLGLTAVLLVAALGGLAPPPVPVIHGLLAVTFIVLLARGGAKPAGA
jgi:hypothetical protein